jgi:UDP-glucose 4-epimerase
VALVPRAWGMFNLGPGRQATIRSVAGPLRDAIDRRLPLGLGEVPIRPDQVMQLEANVGRLRAIAWLPETDLNKGSTRTTKWFCEQQ